jgi:hypothetical protein
LQAARAITRGGKTCCSSLVLWKNGRGKRGGGESSIGHEREAAAAGVGCLAAEEEEHWGGAGIKTDTLLRPIGWTGSLVMYNICRYEQNVCTKLGIVKFQFGSVLGQFSVYWTFKTKMYICSNKFTLFRIHYNMLCTYVRTFICTFAQIISKNRTSMIINITSAASVTSTYSFRPISTSACACERNKRTLISPIQTSFPCYLRLLGRRAFIYFSPGFPYKSSQRTKI